MNAVPPKIFTRKIWCCECQRDVDARLADGREVYPGHEDLADRKFWKCGTCYNFVGTHYQHHMPALRTEPLGCIAGPAMKRIRHQIHELMDPIWMTKKMRRPKLYGKLDRVVGRVYHTAEIRTLDEARAVYRALQKIRKELGMSKR